MAEVKGNQGRRIAKHLTSIVEDNKATWDEVGEAFDILRAQGRFRYTDSPANKTQAPTRIIVGKFGLDILHRDLTLPDGSIVERIPPQPAKTLAALMIHSPQVLTREQIMNHAGIDLDVSDRVVDIYISWLRRRIETGKPPRHLVTVLKTGYLFRP